ncbi:adenosine 5'-monophosphoramidase HINT3-like [Sycon ciliatum]|uniref:adenosine 5'-monophosphoramidase HINT3-like n=1 Tax=Sycon ciliatum TaxID=27933 RepID=UPI0031F6ECDA
MADSSPAISNSDSDEGCKPGCVFCRVARGQDEKTELLFQDEQFVVFRDIRPASSHHYLVVPLNHRGNVKFMEPSQDNFKFVQSMVSIGQRVLEERGADVTSARFGFHWAPFHTIEHLHLHVIAPVTEMGFIARTVFRPNSYWFVTSEWVEERLTPPPQQS